MCTEHEHDLIFLTPIFKTCVWGGRLLETDFGYEIPEGNVGECWGIAAHPNGSSVVASGRFSGATLNELWNDHRELFGDLPGDRFPLLVKILDAREALSVQVHPDDAYAGANENGSLGKRECWYVLSSGDEGKLIIGQHAHDRAEFAEMVASRRWDELLNVIPVHSGDFLAVDPGTVHAICGDTVVLETQQSSDITYRIYDYERTEPGGGSRELHMDKALDVIDFTATPPSTGSITASEVNGVTELWTNPDFTVLRVRVSDDNPVDLQNPWPFLCLSVIEGSGKVKLASKMHALKLGDHLIAPYNSGTLQFSGNLTLIASHV